MIHNSLIRAGEKLMARLRPPRSAEAKFGRLPLSRTTSPEHWRIAIVTRNAIHGGVETMIELQRRLLNADVIVAGGVDFPETCPFPYRRVFHHEDLCNALLDYDGVLYHWPPPWAVEAIAHSGLPSVEFVHRTDTSDCDPVVPGAVVSHSDFLARYIDKNRRNTCGVAPHPLELERFVPAPSLGRFVGGPTTYCESKGWDLLIRAWSQIGTDFPNFRIRCHGRGEKQKDLIQLSEQLNVAAEWLSPVRDTAAAYRAFGCVVIPSRIEGLPMVALEALAMNIPVVAADLPGMRELNRHARRGGFPAPLHLFRSESVIDLARVLAGVLAQTARPNTRPFVAAFHSPAAHLSELRSAFRRAAKAGVLPRRKWVTLAQWDENNVASATQSFGAYFMDGTTIGPVYVTGCDGFRGTTAHFDLFPCLRLELPPQSSALDWLAEADQEGGGTWQLDWLGPNGENLGYTLDHARFLPRQRAGGRTTTLPAGTRFVHASLRPHREHSFRVSRFTVRALCEVSAGGDF